MGINKKYEERKELSTISALKGERVFYQIVFFGGESFEFKVKALHSEKINVMLREVKNVPVHYPAGKKC